jgi:hypothetical protein
MSVVTFVGQGNTAPAMGAVTDRMVNPGVTLLITNTASDADLPAQTLTFAAAGTLPANATLNPASGLFSWRPLVSQANTTNTIQLKVSDNGQPSLSASNSFKIMVGAISAPRVSSITATGGEVQIVANGPAGPDYTLLTSTNLSAWQAIQTVLSPALPVTLADTNHSSGPARFYRIRLGP